MSSHNIALDQDVVVTQLKGKVYLVAADGSQKQLAEGISQGCGTDHS